MTAPRTISLELRKTFAYVGAYQHLDAWQDLGTARILSERETEIQDADADYDACDRRVNRYVVAVASDAPRADIIRALGDSFTHSGCAHDYDCCGCRSYLGRAFHRAGNLYRVTVTSSRNY